MIVIIFTLLLLCIIINLASFWCVKIFSQWFHSLGCGWCVMNIVLSYFHKCVRHQTNPFSSSWHLAKLFPSLPYKPCGPSLEFLMEWQPKDCVSRPRSFSKQMCLPHALFFFCHLDMTEQPIGCGQWWQGPGWKEPGALGTCMEESCLPARNTCLDSHGSKK